MIAHGSSEQQEREASACVLTEAGCVVSADVFVRCRSKSKRARQRASHSLPRSLPCEPRMPESSGRQHILGLGAQEGGVRASDGGRVLEAILLQWIWRVPPSSKVKAEALCDEINKAPHMCAITRIERCLSAREREGPRQRHRRRLRRRDRVEHDDRKRCRRRCVCSGLRGERRLRHTPSAGNLVLGYICAGSYGKSFETRGWIGCLLLHVAPGAWCWTRWSSVAHTDMCILVSAYIAMNRQSHAF